MDRFRTVFRVAAAVAAVALLTAPSFADTEMASEGRGLVISIAGDVTVHRSDATVEVSEGFVLEDGDTIIVKSGGRCSGFTPMGEPFSLAGPAQLVLTGSVESGLVGNVASWIQNQLAQWIGESRRQPLTTRAVRGWDVAVDAPAPLLPAPNASVRPKEAKLLWSTVPGIDSYTVTVAPALGEEEVHIVRGNSMVLDNLSAGEEYVWKVRPSMESWHGEAGWRAFRVLTAEEERQLDSAVEALDDLGAGVLLLSSGLHEEAVYRLDGTVSGGEDADAARLWRAQALAEIGLYRQAYEDLMRLRGE